MVSILAGGSRLLWPTALHTLRRPRRGGRRPRRRFSFEARQLGATTADLPEPLRGGLIGWLYELLALLRRARRADPRSGTQAAASSIGQVSYVITPPAQARSRGQQPPVEVRAAGHPPPRHGRGGAAAGQSPASPRLFPRWTPRCKAAGRAAASASSAGRSPPASSRWPPRPSPPCSKPIPRPSPPGWIPHAPAIPTICTAAASLCTGCWWRTPIRWPTRWRCCCTWWRATRSVSWPWMRCRIGIRRRRHPLCRPGAPGPARGAHGHRGPLSERNTGEPTRRWPTPRPCGCSCAASSGSHAARTCAATRARRRSSRIASGRPACGSRCASSSTARCAGRGYEGGHENDRARLSASPTWTPPTSAQRWRCAVNPAWQRSRWRCSTAAGRCWLSTTGRPPPGSASARASARPRHGRHGWSPDRLTATRIWETQAELLAAVARYAGRWQPAGLGAAYLDLAGIGGDLASWSQALIADVGKLGLACGLGLASGKFSAQIAGQTTPHTVRLLAEPAAERAFVEPQPVTWLPLGAEAVRHLLHLGVRTLGAYGRLPAAGVLARFGALGRDRAALGAGTRRPARAAARRAAARRAAGRVRRAGGGSGDPAGEPAPPGRAAAGPVQARFQAVGRLTLTDDTRRRPAAAQPAHLPAAHRRAGVDPGDTQTRSWNARPGVTPAPAK